VWVSAFINVSGAPAQVIDAFLADQFVPVISNELFDEIREVLYRPRILRRWQVRSNAVATVLTLLADRAIQVIPTSSLHLCRDPDDDVLLETAILGSVQYFVSRDDDIKRDRELMTRLRESGVEVLSVAQFLRLLVAG
jgi:putative PIN family toxin of toxin-antitoxin system